MNQTLRTNYRVREIRALLEDDEGREDLDLTLELRNVLVERLKRALKHPNTQKNPEGALLAEMLNQLL